MQTAYKTPCKPNLTSPLPHRPLYRLRLREPNPLGPPPNPRPCLPFASQPPLHLLCLLAITLLAPGCQNKPPAESFFPEQDTLATSHILDTQSARGTRADATLHALHFDNTTLNDLARHKLDLMLKDNSTPFPLVIYLDLPENDPQTPARAKSVTDHLTSAGLLPTQFQTHLGPNPATLHPAAPLLSKPDKPADQTATSSDPSPTSALGISIEKK